MGYYTTFTLSIYGERKARNGFVRDLINKSDNNTDVLTLTGEGCVNAKLHNLDDWIDEIAPNYPELLIVLNGCGEEQDDIWETRWKGEETETHIICMPPFENEHLQVPEKEY